MLEQRAKIEEGLSGVVDFEEALGNITDKPLDTSNLVPFTISKLASTFHFLNWTAFFQSAFKKVNNDSSIDENTEILVQVIDL